MLLLCEIFITEHFSFMKKSYQSLEDNSTNNMKQVKNRNLTIKSVLLGFVFLLSYYTTLLAQDGSPA
mgnify:CR=1 FL=1